MADIFTTRKPGRSVFFEDPGPESRQGNGVTQRDQSDVAIGADVEVQLRLLLDALKAAKEGKFSVRLPDVRNGILGEIAQTFNEVLAFNESMTNEIVRVSKIISEEGKLTERASLPGASGMWAITVDSINTLIDSLAQPTTEVEVEQQRRVQYVG